MNIESPEEKFSDKWRLGKFLNLLPEGFIDDFLNNYLWNGYYRADFRKRLLRYEAYSKEILSEFSNRKINKGWKTFNNSFDTLIRFLNEHFWIPDAHHERDDSPPFVYLRPDIHHNFMEGVEQEKNETIEDRRERRNKASAKWDRYKQELDVLATEVEKEYKNFLKTANKYLIREGKKKKRWRQKWLRPILIGIFVLVVGTIILDLLEILNLSDFLRKMFSFK